MKKAQPSMFVRLGPKIYVLFTSKCLPSTSWLTHVTCQLIVLLDQISDIQGNLISPDGFISLALSLYKLAHFPCYFYSIFKSSFSIIYCNTSFGI